MFTCYDEFLSSILFLLFLYFKERTGVQLIEQRIIFVIRNL